MSQEYNMEFFNKKEDVIDLQLTQFGRHLLSKGLFKPEYYSFFDDNILYDSSRAGVTENQNDSEERIRETQTIQPQIAISSLEKEFNTSYSMIMANEVNAYTAVLQKTAEKNYALPQPLGTSDLGSEYLPSWSVRYLKGKITGSSNNLSLQEKSGGNNIIDIPQLTTEVVVEIATLDGETSEDPMEPGGSDITLLNRDDVFVLLKISESNSEFQKKNFDIEMFEVVEQKEGSTTIESLRPLYFDKPYNPSDSQAPQDDVTPVDSQEYIAHYFDLKIDNEIDSKILCEHDPVNENLGVFADERTVICQDILNQQESVPFNIYEGGTGDIPGDIC
jgi:hypothetical protein